MAGKQLRMTLLENGLDFIREGVEALYGGHGSAPPHASKYALLHVFSGTLLVLKEKLRRAHESLIFRDVSKSGEANARTVDFDEVIHRLEGAAKVRVDKNAKDLLRKVQIKRNALEHYEADLELDEVNGLVGELVDFLERFLHEELGESLFKHVSGAAGREIADLAKVAERLRERSNAEWQERAASFRSLSDEELDGLAEEGDYHPKHNPDAVLLACPSCEEDAVAVASKDVGVCTNHDCRELHVLATCDRCGSLSILGDEVYCDECNDRLRELMDKDD